LKLSVSRRILSLRLLLRMQIVSDYGLGTLPLSLGKV
jgi:hypothetical protein